MNKWQSWTCRKLIELLLDHPPHQRGELLQSWAELVNMGLAVEMTQYADFLFKEGDEQNAQWLITQAIEIASSIEEDSAARLLQNAIGFAAEIVERIAESLFHGNLANRSQDLFEFLNTNSAQLDETLLKALPAIFELYTANRPPEVRESAAIIFDSLGDLMTELSFGEEALNLELAISAYEIALQGFTLEASPELWAMIQVSLAKAYCDRIEGEEVDNLERAISAYESALHVYTQSSFPDDWARIDQCLAITYARYLKAKREKMFFQVVEQGQTEIEQSNYYFVKFSGLALIAKALFSGTELVAQVIGKIEDEKLNYQELDAATLAIEMLQHVHENGGKLKGERLGSVLKLYGSIGNTGDTELSISR